MPWSILFFSRSKVNKLDTSANEIQTSIKTYTNEENNEYDQTLARNYSLISTFNYVLISWRQICSTSSRILVNFICLTIRNIATRLTCIALFRSISPSSYASSSQISEETSSRTPTISRLKKDSPSSENSTMAHILVQQQQTHQSTSPQNETLAPIGHKVDEEIFFYKQDSASFLHLLQQIATDSQLNKYHSSSNTNSIQFPLSNSFLSSNEIHEQTVDDKQDINYTSTDRLESLTKEDIISDPLDATLAANVIDELDDDSILNLNSSLNSERHFRRRKRRTSLTRTSLSNDDDDDDDAELNNTDSSIEENNSNQVDKVQDLNETLERISLNENQEKTEESIDTTISSSRFRGRRFRLRSHQQTLSISQESTTDSQVQFFVPNEISISPPLPTPPSSPIAISTNAPLSTNSRSASTGGLKRTCSIGTTKKMVRFADSVGRQLAQVQYIQSLADDDSTDLSFLKNKLYVPKSLNFEYKPWTFDVELTSKQTPDIRIPKRFFCLFRQPNSEHPDIYLHQVWKTQIKLEYSNMRLKSSLTGEQCLYGTAWVTNAGYDKHVTIQYTFNRWMNKYEYDAKHCCHSNDFRNIDQFEFSIDIPNDVDKVDFVLRYRINGQEYWDNNDGRNYTLETESAYTPQTTISLPHDCNFNEMRFY